MSLEEALKVATLKEIEWRDSLALYNFARWNHDTIQFLYGKKIITDTDIERAIEKAVINEAKGDYNHVLSKRAYPDHVARPEFLAYAISNGSLTSEQVAKIKFDHGENPESFCQLYGRKNLLTELREEMLNPKPLPAIHLDDAEHPVCNCALG